MMLWNEDFLLTHPVEVSKQFFYIMGIVFHLPPLGIQKLTTAWVICCLLLTTRSTNDWPMTLKWMDWYTKYPGFLCLLDSRTDDQHYVRQEWPLRQELKPGSHKIQSHLLVEPNKKRFFEVYPNLPPGRLSWYSCLVGNWRLIAYESQFVHGSPLINDLMSFILVGSQLDTFV